LLAAPHDWGKSYRQALRKVSFDRQSRMKAGMRARGHACPSASRRSDQGELWAAIEAKSAKLRVASRTSAMADIYQQQQHERLRSFEDGFAPLPKQALRS
jgi:hypothetical protein